MDDSYNPDLLPDVSYWDGLAAHHYVKDISPFLRKTARFFHGEDFYGVKFGPPPLYDASGSKKIVFFAPHRWAQLPLCFFPQYGIP